MRTKRKSLIEERYQGIKKRQLNFMRMVQERVSKMKTSLTPFLPNDLMFKIFLLLPIKSLLRFRCVCKSWNKLIHCSEFVEAYNNEAQTTAIFLRAIGRDRFNTFHLESQVNQLEAFSIFPCTPAEIMRSNVINFLEIEDGKSKVIDLNISCLGKIVATCNGLILISSMFERKRTASQSRSGEREMATFDSHERPGRLIIMNPMTRKFFGFPLGTVPSDPSHSESYGLVFSHSKGVFKVVHLFKDELGHIACEVWSMESRYWKAIDGPSENVLRWFTHAPISTNEALHWLPRRYHHQHIDYIVSMNAEDERFFVTDLPKSVSVHDKLVEMGGFLTFVSSLDMDHIEIWVLKGLEGTEWIKQHTIHIDAVVGYVENKEYSVPVLAVNAKEMIFRRRKKFYSYDFELEEVTEIEMDGGSIAVDEFLIPHTNNLATWEPLEPMQ
ncbi:F-box protein At5g49610-like [Silene latifolia]|uniref:F-box protein At5g49610-like n=1 Tax=Silene latifolia TaxID=37657 RepID=UPI003D783BC9